MAESWRLRRTGDVDLEFNGELLADASSRGSGPRWTEIRLYRTDSGRYVVEQVGRSLMPDELDRRAASDYATALEARDALRQSHQRFLTHVARRAIAAAAESDPAFAQVLTDRVE